MIQRLPEKDILQHIFRYESRSLRSANSGFHILFFIR